MSFRFRIFICLVGGLLLLQATDFALTWLLLGGRPDVYESNPLARSILDRGGWHGLAAFKIGITAVAVAAGLVLARRRLTAAVRLMAVLCCVVLGVNVYSGSLLASPDQSSFEERRMLAAEVALTARMRATFEFAALRDEVCDDLLADVLGADEAADLLAENVRRFAPLLRLPAAARLPDPATAGEVEAYLAFHLRARASARGLDAETADLIGHRPVAEVDEEQLEPAWLRAGLTMY